MSKRFDVTNKQLALLFIKGQYYKSSAGNNSKTKI